MPRSRPANCVSLGEMTNPDGHRVHSGERSTSARPGSSVTDPRRADVTARTNVSTGYGALNLKAGRRPLELFYRDFDPDSFANILRALMDGPALPPSRLAVRAPPRPRCVAVITRRTTLRRSGSDDIKANQPPQQAIAFLDRERMSVARSTRGTAGGSVPGNARSVQPYHRLR
jgi:hypothetical protein